MKVRVLALLLWATLPLAAEGGPSPGVPSPALAALGRRLPPAGERRTLELLGLDWGYSDQVLAPTGARLVLPVDLDNRTPDPARYPTLHLNLPLEPTPGPVRTLFLCDQPETVDDQSGRLDGSRGAEGIACRGSFPARENVRVLADHVNGSREELDFQLWFVGRQDGWVSVRRRGEAAHEDMVEAARRAWGVYHAPLPVQPHPVSAGRPLLLVRLTVAPGCTALVQAELRATTAGELVSGLCRPHGTLMDLPVLDSPRWSDKADHLKGIVDPVREPRSYARLLTCFEHARGLFPWPDRVARGVYRPSGWEIHYYSPAPAIPGVDPTLPAPTENRGCYGAVVGLEVDIDRLPPECSELALVALNLEDTFGGRLHATNGRLAYQIECLAEPELLRAGWALTVWRGPVRAGDLLRLSLEPLANTSVHLVYALIPLAGNPVALRRGPTAAERSRAQEIVRAHGRPTVARFTLFPDKFYFFSSGGSVIAFVQKGPVALALGDPIGPAEDVDSCLEEFARLCQGNDWSPAFYQVLPDHLESYCKAGYQALKIGHEAIIGLQQFSTAGKAGKGSEEDSGSSMSIPELSRFLMLDIYDKDEAEDLSPDERRLLGGLAETYRREEMAQVTERRRSVSTEEVGALLPAPTVIIEVLLGRSSHHGEVRWSRCRASGVRPVTS